ncbi:MAG: hypothetical protein QNJ22_05525 [Desulfosarcinaceae bacterium]|nr:hypothetical protein [Desulfosarcinaceae bacterium]
MKTTLHILRDEPDEITAALIQRLSADGSATVVALYPDGINPCPVDWQRLVRDIFNHDRVICW